MIQKEIFVLLTAVTIATSQSKVGDVCTDAITNTMGRCKSPENCESATNDWNTLGRRPTFCAYTATEILVCCKDVGAVKPLPAMATGSTRVSTRKCAEYFSYVTRKDPVRILGIPTSQGGEEADYGEFPHVVAIGTSADKIVKFLCPGNLISRRFVLTVAHCATYHLTPDTVLLGEIDVDVFSLSQYTGNGLKVPIKKIIQHPNYKHRKRNDDIALLELDTDVAITDTVRPACLWLDDDFDGNDKALASGWGVYNEMYKSSNLLLKEDVTMLPNDSCNKILTIYTPKWSELKDTYICVKGHEYICKASGSPLQIYKKQNPGIHYIAGLSAFGRKPCTTEATFFVRVAKYVDWIESIVWPGEK